MAQQDEAPALLKPLWVWLAVGVSQMSPLQFVQFLAAIFAIVYSAIHSYKTLREMYDARRAKGPEQ